ncbi:MAG: hypothetical protein ABFD96_03215 [Armatimonadia bacterium]
MRITPDFRFAIIPEWLLDSAVSAQAIRLFAVMARYADKDSDQACRSRATLADRARCSAATVDRSLRELRSVGAVSWEQRQDERGQAPSEFRLHFLRTALIAGDDHPLIAGDEPSSIDQDREVTPNGVTRQPSYGKSPWRTDPLWDALAREMRRQPETTSERGRWNHAVKELRDAGATPADIEARSVEYRRRWPKVEFTPTGLAANWGTLGTPRTGPVERALAGLRGER